MRAEQSLKPSTRDRLIAGAFAVVARDGLEAASVKAIAAAAGVTPGLLHYHFASKDALLHAALSHGLDDYRLRTERLICETPPHRIIPAFFAMLRAHMDSDADVFRVRLPLAARAISDPALADQLETITKAAVAIIARVMAAADCKTEVSEAHRVMAIALKATFDGVMLARLISRDFPTDGLITLFDQAVRGWLRD